MVEEDKNRRKITTVIDKNILKRAIEIYVRKYGIRTRGLISAVIEEALRKFIKEEEEERREEEEVKLFEL